MLKKELIVSIKELEKRAMNLEGSFMNQVNTPYRSYDNEYSKFLNNIGAITRLGHKTRLTQLKKGQLELMYEKLQELSIKYNF